MSESKAVCLVCKHAPAETVCPNCGVESGKLLDLIHAWPRPELSLSFFMTQEQLTRARQQSEEVWALLSVDFQNATLAQYRALLDRKSRVIDGCMVATNLVTFAAGYLLGAWFMDGVLRWNLGLSSRTIFSTVVAFFLALLIGSAIESRLGRSQAAVTLRDFERSFRLIGLALMSRIRSPLYAHPDLLFPFSAVCGIAIGMAL